MKEKISAKITALTFGVLVLVFAIGFLVFAWTEPVQAPPGGNVPTPINVGSTPQTKEAKLTIDAAGGGDALVIKTGGDLRIYTSDNTGSAVLYVDNNGELTTSDNLKVGNTIVKNNGSISSNLNADKLDDYHAADLMAGGGGATYFLACSCPAGSQEVTTVALDNIVSLGGHIAIAWQEEEVYYQYHGIIDSAGERHVCCSQIQIQIPALQVPLVACVKICKY